MISFDNIQKAYGGQELFDGVSFKLNAREKVGLVGRNGHGKTTLLRMLVRQAQPDAGSIVVPRHYRIGYVEQHLQFSQTQVLAEAMQALPPNEADHHWKAERVLSGLGFQKPDQERPPQELSGGYQVRLNLAKMLISEPDLLLLDEPTNYLDITSIRWVVRFLQDWSRELLLITHDRSFMDQVVTHVIGLHRRKARKIKGDTAKYYDQLAQDEEIYEKTRLNDERRRKEIELFISRFRAKARLANMVQSRIKTLSKMEKREKLEAAHNLDFTFREAPFRGRQMMAAEDLAFGYEGGPTLFAGLSFNLNHGDRIAVIGPNGQGKTTLLKALAGELMPRAGCIRLNPAVRMGFYEQTHADRLLADRTVEEEIMAAGGDLDRQNARNICGAMLFRGDEALKKIQVLSGGERSRVLLGKLLASPLNLLLLDEPTNHLDMEACDALLAAIDHFEGAVIMVTHNEMFLHAVARRLIVFQNHRALLFEGGYQRFLETGGWLEEKIGPRERRATDEPRAGKNLRREARRERSEIVALKGKTLKPLESEMARIEKDIEACEAQLKDLQAAMQAATNGGDVQQIGDLGRAIQSADQTIEAGFARLETIHAAWEQARSRFDAQLEAVSRKYGDLV